MTLRRRRSHYQQLAKLERGSITELKIGEFSFHDIVERLCRNVCTVHDFWLQWSREGSTLRKLLLNHAYSQHIVHRSAQQELQFLSSPE
ncbi:hypothetical protein TNCV_4385681 [Trichonephila clavipes]|nr:hypothetical protein TNCV_4385681 [Trichonephila clavipes]